MSSPTGYAAALLRAMGVYEQLYGTIESVLERRAVLGAIAAVFNQRPLEGDELDELIDQVVADGDAADDDIADPEEADSSLREKVLQAIAQQAKSRLEEARNTLTETLQAYLQRVTAKLEVADFLELAKTAIALFDRDQPGPRLSRGERQLLLAAVARRFGRRLSQPIPAIGQQLPPQVSALVSRLAKYRQLLQGDTPLEPALMAMAVRAIREGSRRFSPELVRNVLKHSSLTVEKLPPSEVEDIVSSLYVKLQFQLDRTRGSKSAEEFEAQINEAVADFQKRQNPAPAASAPLWTGEFSVSSPITGHLLDQPQPPETQP